MALFSTKFPFRLAVANVFMDGESRSPEEALAELLPLYPDEEKLCNAASVDMNMQALKAVGILAAAESTEAGVFRCRITTHGREKVTRNI